MVAVAMAPQLLLPWESTADEDRRFYRILRNSLVVFALCAVVVPLLQVSELSREHREAVPPQLARVILEKKELPPPPVVKQVKPKPELVTKPKPKPKPKPKAKTRPVDKLEQARRLAAESGVLAFKDDLADMRDSLDATTLDQQHMSRGQSQAEVTERAIITSNRSAGSGGIQTARLSRDTGGAALSGRQTTKVENTMASHARKAAQSQSVQMGGRSDESIRRVMDRNKSALFALYNRALRKDPLLQGKLVFEMVIDAAGVVVEIRLLSSELSDERLNNKILSRIRLIDFGAEAVLRTRVNYSFDFLPYS